MLSLGLWISMATASAMYNMFFDDDLFITFVFSNRDSIVGFPS